MRASPSIKKGRKPAPRPAARRAAQAPSAASRGRAERLRALATRCRGVAEQTALPEIARELGQIARALDDEAAREGGD